MEALVALGLTCNVLQVISFSREAILLATKISKDGSVDINLAKDALQLEALSNELDASINNQASTVLQGYHELLSIARDCNTTAKEIKKEMGLLSTSSWGKVGRTVKALRRRSALEQLEKTLLGHQQTLQSRLLYQIYKTQDATQAQHLAGFAALDNGLQDLIRQYSQGQIQIEDLVKGNAADMLRHLTSDLTKIESLVSSEHEKTRKCVSDFQNSLEAVHTNKNKRQRLLQSLQFDAMNNRRTQIDPPYSNTFEWVFKAKDSDVGSSFRTWIQSDKPVFWISGKPGSGKSTLMKYLSSDVPALERLSTGLLNCVVYSYFIWNSGSKIERSLRGMYCSLLHQIFKKTPKIADRTLQKHPELLDHNSLSDWEMMELSGLLNSVLRLHRQPICLFIDGLDEIDAQENPLDLVEIIQGISAGDKVLKLCISSRPEPVWNASLNNLPSLRLQDLTRQDMSVTAKGLLNKYFPSFLLQRSTAEVDIIVNSLLNKAEGVFLWLHLALRSLQRGLCGEESEADLFRRLEVLPQGIQQLYQDMWKRLGDDESLFRQQAAHYFNLVTRWSSLYEDSHIQDLPFDQSITSLGVLLASDKSIQEIILRRKDKFTESSATMEALRNIKNKVETRCAGLLELSPTGNIPERIDLTPDKLFARGKIKNFRISFVHRTARDYLLNTAEGLELLNAWSYTDEELNSSIIKAMICYALVLANPNRCGFKIPTLGSQTWVFDTDLNLQRVLRVLEVCLNYESAPTKETVFEVLWILKEEYESRSLTTFLEHVAESGFFEWLQHFLDNNELKMADKRAVESYLFSRHLGRRYGRRLGYTLDYSIVDHSLDLGWSSIHTAAFPDQSVPMLNSIVENALLIIMDNPYHWLRLFKDEPTPWFLREDIVDFRKKLLLQVENLVTTGIIYPRYQEGWSVFHRGGERPDSQVYSELNSPRTEFILEVNIAQLVNSAISSVLWVLPLANEEDPTIISQEAQLKSFLYEPEKCHCKILIAGYFNKPFASGEKNRWDAWSNIGRFCEPTERQSDILAERIFASGLPHLGHNSLTLSEGKEIQELVESMFLESSHRITDISDSLRKRGYYIPTQGDIDAYIHGKTFEDRVLAMENMNKKHAESIVFDERKLSRNKKPDAGVIGGE
ncbi:hypothetical protein GJ744_009933 [Endocarpon pusillum]|uniref:NACHT domain-containing protein n=1 Tax=Endocarpon pusillum TaxID=364733 RepID=A0A8H7AGY3_9EURO|nr:hypothetical protein GJ744_009933 [Endocarpon pusillum]